MHEASKKTRSLRIILLGWALGGKCAPSTLTTSEPLSTDYYAASPTVQVEMGNKTSSEKTMSASQRRISRPVVTSTAEERKQHLRDITLSEPMTSRDRKRRRKENEKSRERNRSEREQRKLGMEAKWSAGNRRYQASLLSERRSVQQSTISERDVASESRRVPTQMAPITTATMAHDDEPDWARDI